MCIQDIVCKKVFYVILINHYTTNVIHQTMAANKVLKYLKKNMLALYTDGKILAFPTRAKTLIVS